MRRTLFLLFAVTILGGCEAPPKMHVERTTFAVTEDVVVTFDERLSGRATNQYWIALQPVDAAISDTTGRLILERSDRVVKLHASSPGAYEIRLHGQYPKEEHHLLVRIPVTITSWPVKADVGPVMSTEPCLDRWLVEHKLDPYGSPEGTQYIGGTPLFDPATGKSITRWDFVTSMHPEVLRACEGVAP